MTDPQYDPATPDLSVSQLPQIVPADQVFLGDDGQPSATGAAEPPIRKKKHGPGLWESFAWMLGTHAVQIAATALAGTVLVVSYVMTSGEEYLQKEDVAGLIRSLFPILSSNLVPVLGAAQLATVLFALLAIRLRFGRHALRDLGFHRPWSGHWLLVGLLIPPLWLLCSVLQAAAYQSFPDAGQAMQELMQAMSEAPLSMLVLVVGLGPAIGEELLFRGLIGRGLLSRYGFLAGILLTSVLFGVMHVTPGQAIAVIPIGLAMHFVYYTTRSFWAPVTLHFINNSLSVLLLKNSHLPAIARLDQLVESQGGVPLYILVASAAMVTAILTLLWQTRVQFVLSDGTIWNPGYVTACAPPPELGARPVRQDPRLLMLAGSTFNSLGFAAGLCRLMEWPALLW